MLPAPGDSPAPNGHLNGPKPIPVRHRGSIAPEYPQSMTTFCTNSSLRGVAKLVKYQSWFLRVLWFSFVVSQTIFLLVGTTNLVVQYLDYSTIINTITKAGDVADFPAITVCNHHPFGDQSEEIWDSGEVMTPRNFSANIRKMMNQLIDANKLREAREFFNNDKLSTYMETIGLDAAKRIGNQPEIIANCMLQLKDSVRMGHHNECGIVITRHVTPSHFNCYTVNVLPRYTKQTISLGLIIRVGKEPSSVHLNYSLLQNVLHQAHGCLITLHEVGTYPDTVGHSTSLEPGKTTSMTYETIKFTAVNSPKQACRNTHTHDGLASTYTIDDRIYNYTESVCQSNNWGKMIQQLCNCHSSMFPISDVEKHETNLPSCHGVDFTNYTETYHRFRCYHDIYQNNITQGIVDEEMQMDKCLPLCTQYQYVGHASTAQWRAADWQLNWLMRLSDAWEDLEENVENSSLPVEGERIQDAIKTLKEFTSPQSEQATNYTLAVNENVFFMMSRKNFDTERRVETFSISVSKLLSSLGGLSSITIGITFATAFELVEFIFLVCTGKQLSRKARLREKERKKEETEFISSVKS